MKKLNNYNEIKNYNPNLDLTPENYREYEKEWYAEEYTHEKEKLQNKPNLICDCGNDEFKVEWWDYPYTGGLCRIYCTKCKKVFQLIDDYA